MADYRVVGSSVTKVDALSLAQGTMRFTDDYTVDRPLELRFVYSTVAHARVTAVDTSSATTIPGVVGVWDHRNTTDRLFTTAGQGYPEPSPYDARLFPDVVRYVGDPVCLVAAETREAADQAARAVRISYEELPAVLDAEHAKDDGAPRIHDSGEYPAIPVPYHPERNQAAEVSIAFGDVKAGLERAEIVSSHRYTTHYASHCPIEPHSCVVRHDEQGRLEIITSTQVPFHARRIVSRLLDIPIRRIRVVKPRLGGGFGIKQEVILEPYAALVARDTGRNVRLIMSREEVFRSTRTRHPMRIDMTAGLDADGWIHTLQMDALMNTGAYGAHALTVLSNAGSKVLPLLNKVENLAFNGSSVYTNLPVGGAYRGYGATQGYFALNQELDIISRRLGVDMVEYCKRWHIKEGETSGVFRALGEGTEGVEQIIASCGLTECIDRGAEAIGWSAKRDQRRRPTRDAVRGVGMAIAMQGSGIPKIDMGAATMKMNEDGSFNLFVGATDLGTGSDTVLAQIAAEVLHTTPEMIIVLSSDTDLTPFDVGAYASSTTYISGNAVLTCAQKVLGQVTSVAAAIAGCETTDLTLSHAAFTTPDGTEVTFEQVAYRALYAEDQFQIQASASHTSEVSPPPFIAQFAEVEVDLRTGEVRVPAFVSAVDCGTAINPALAEGQIEGAALNGISFALTEEYRFSRAGELRSTRFGGYGLWNTQDLPDMKTILVETADHNGPFGAKSVGEIGINGPAPAIANAIFDAVGVRCFDLPIKPEQILAALRENGGTAADQPTAHQPTADHAHEGG